MDDSLLYGIATLGVGLLALVVRYTFKSKCIKVNLCYGLIQIDRDVEVEMEGETSPNIQRTESNLEK